jgi:hypothetical protein
MIDYLFWVKIIDEKGVQGIFFGYAKTGPQSLLPPRSWEYLMRNFV